MLDGFDTIEVGVDPRRPDLRGTIAADRSADLRRLLVDDPGTSGARSALDLAAAQVAVLHEHVGFLRAARDEGNLPNVRFHGEHMVNITRGAPLRDVDGNGEVSNPATGWASSDGRCRLHRLAPRRAHGAAARATPRSASSPAAARWPGPPRASRRAGPSLTRSPPPTPA